MMERRTGRDDGSAVAAEASDPLDNRARTA